jgi:hypothetical protein
MIIEWDDIKYHKSHLGTNLEKEITGIVMPSIDMSRSLVMGHILSFLETEEVLKAPIVEVRTYRNIQNIPIFEDAIIAFKNAAQTSKAYRGMVSGWKVEEDNGKEYAAIVGWSSLEEHIAATTTSPLMEELKKAVEYSGYIEAHHFVPTQWTI